MLIPSYERPIYRLYTNARLFLTENTVCVHDKENHFLRYLKKTGICCEDSKKHKHILWQDEEFLNVTTHGTHR
jgi:hypothetical protein